MTERKTVKKWFWVWEFEKEERWLNEMAMQGWALDGLGFCTYHFIPCEPGEYTVRLEMHEPESEYLDFMASTGAEYVGRMVKWIFFRKKTADGPFDLYSDIDSRLKHLERIGRMLGAIAIANIGIGISSSIAGTYVGWINLLCAAVLAYGLGRIHEKREKLKADRLLME